MPRAMLAAMLGRFIVLRATLPGIALDSILGMTLVDSLDSNSITEICYDCLSHFLVSIQLGEMPC